MDSFFKVGRNYRITFSDAGRQSQISAAVVAVASPFILIDRGGKRVLINTTCPSFLSAESSNDESVTGDSHDQEIGERLEEVKREIESLKLSESLSQRH